MLSMGCCCLLLQLLHVLLVLCQLVLQLLPLLLTRPLP
jgi:hypothetical protein